MTVHNFAHAHQNNQRWCVKSQIALSIPYVLYKMRKGNVSVLQTIRVMADGVKVR